MKAISTLPLTVLVAGLVLAAIVPTTLLGEEPPRPPEAQMNIADPGSPDSLRVYWSTGMKGQVKPCG